ncbi:MAG: type II toxin-antitoxin system HicA family toxin [Candidatus Aenigmarchaeota archaeon]|nr:type II toxin-antitoxin system HicA family toxin [Candidatus Aenigmarchaeota archaeon]
MPKLPVLSGHDVVKALSKVGFSESRQKGSHIVLVKFSNGKKKAVVIPNHMEVDKGTLLEIIRQSGLTRQEFLQLL